MSSTTTAATTSTKRGTKAESSAASTGKKHHVCPVCERGFSTTGHLARHARVHTGERNHKCPFPGCETKCSRQDNLQQHYRIHLSPGSRRKSGRSVLRSQSTPAPSPTADSPSASSSNDNPGSIRDDSPPLSPPPLEDSRLYYFNAQGSAVESPPTSPPPLVEAYPTRCAEDYRADVLVPNPYPQTHRTLPHIDTSSRISSPGYWSTSSVSDGYGDASAYPSPAAYQSTSASAYPSPTVPTEYATSPVQYAHPHTFRHTSHSPAAAAVPVARSLTARHSIANIGAHVQQQQRALQTHHSLELEDARTVHLPMAQMQLHQPAPHCPASSAHQSPQAYTVQHQEAAASYAPEAYHDVEPQQHPDTPSPPPSSHQSPQTPYTPFQESSGVYIPHASYPSQAHGGDMHPVQYDGQAQDMHVAHEHYSAQSPNERPYHHAYAAAPQEAEFAPYDGRGHVVNMNFAYGSVPAMQFHAHEQAPEVYVKQQQHAYVDAPPKAYSPLLLAALPSLRRESVAVAGSEGGGYAAARRDSEVLTPATLSSFALAGYARPRYSTHSRAQSPQARHESYGAGSYAPAVQAPYLHHPQPQPPLAGEYLVDYTWRVAEVQ